MSRRYMDDRDWTRQKAVEAFIRAAEALHAWQRQDHLSEALFWGALGVLRVAQLCSDSSIEKAIGFVRAAQEARSA